MSKLIAKLNELQHLTPDEIVQQISAPISKWRRLNTFTREEYVKLYQSGIQVTLFNLRDERYLGMYSNFELRRAEFLTHWPYETFSIDRTSNAHWYLINNEFAKPFQIGIDNVEADREADRLGAPRPG